MPLVLQAAGFRHSIAVHLPNEWYENVNIIQKLKLSFSKSSICMHVHVHIYHCVCMTNVLMEAFGVGAESVTCVCHVISHVLYDFFYIEHLFMFFLVSVVVLESFTEHNCRDYEGACNFSLLESLSGYQDSVFLLR